MSIAEMEARCRVSSFESIVAPVADEFAEVDSLILEYLSSEVPFIDEVSHYIIDGGGKRLRPLLVLLSARANGYSGRKHLKVAAMIELLHTATLLHDDVVDESELRRGRTTVNAKWNNAAAVLVGDFLVSRVFELFLSLKQPRLFRLLANAANHLAEGEVRQLTCVHDPDIDEDRYFEVIESKTATLFEVAAQAGAALAHAPGEVETAMTDYARHLGIAFQLVDDYLDYASSAAAMGKKVGDDLAEGKPTLPLIYAMRTGSRRDATFLRRAIAEGGLAHLNRVLEILESTGALDYTLSKAREEADRAADCLMVLPESEFREALIGLAELAVERAG